MVPKNFNDFVSCIRKEFERLVRSSPPFSLSPPVLHSLTGAAVRVSSRLPPRPLPLSYSLATVAISKSRTVRLAGAWCRCGNQVTEGVVTLKPQQDPPTVPMDYTWAKQLGLVRKPAEFVTSISDERGEELLYAGMPISKTFEVGCVCHATLATPCHDKSPSSPPLIDPHPFHPPLAPLTLLCCAMLCLHLVLSCAGGHWNRWRPVPVVVPTSVAHLRHEVH